MNSMVGDRLAGDAMKSAMKRKPPAVGPRETDHCNGKPSRLIAENAATRERARRAPAVRMSRGATSRLS